MELLKELKLNGIKLAIVSNKLDPAVKELNQLYFKEDMTSAVGEMEEEGIRKKPAPDMVQKALKELQVSAEDAIYAVSYTHLDVYKRQVDYSNKICMKF